MTVERASTFKLRERTMPMKIANITLDCEEPLKVAEFWSKALGLTFDDGASEFFVSMSPADSHGPNLFFAKVPEAKSTKNRQHLDFESDDPVAEVARLVELGATHVADKNEWGHAWSIMADPEGNEFCVSGPHEDTAEG